MRILSKSLIQKAILSTAIIVVAYSCQQPNTNIVDKLGANIITQTVIANETGKSDSTISYSFYLPESYDGKKKLPVVFFLDPHANGSMPINNYSSLANKYGYIFIASNDIMNGQSGSYSRKVFKQLLVEAKKRFTIDENRLFTAGFSGGAKLAIIFAQQIPEIIGVAACGASMPIIGDTKPNYYYAGIVGNQDFNYLEVQQTFTVFDQQGFDYTSEIFDGGHQWPSVNSFEMAIIGFDIFSIKSSRLAKNEEWLDVIWTKMNNSISNSNENKDIIKENVFISQTSRWFYGLRNTTDLKKRAYEIRQSQQFYNLIKKHQKVIQTEVKLRSEFIRAIELRDMDWWTGEIERINKSIEQTDEDIAQVSQRLLNYLSMVSFMLVKTDLDDNRIDNAINKLEIYKLVDATNPDVYLMYARYYMLQDNIDMMINSFKEAQELGFNDYENYKSQLSWKELFERDEIKTLIEL